jgi:YHS domain-containing protein
LRGLFESGRSEVKVPRPRPKAISHRNVACGSGWTWLSCGPKFGSCRRGKTYCFGNKEAMAEFMKNPKDNLAKAQSYYSSKHPG